MMSSNATHIIPNIGRTSHRATRDFNGQNRQQLPSPRTNIPKCVIRSTDFITGGFIQ